MGMARRTGARDDRDLASSVSPSLKRADGHLCRGLQGAALPGELSEAARLRAAAGGSLQSSEAEGDYRNRRARHVGTTATSLAPLQSIGKLTAFRRGASPALLFTAPLASGLRHRRCPLGAC